MSSGASNFAGPVDLLFAAITAISIFFTAGIFVAIIYFSVRYRRGHNVDRSNPPLYNEFVETVWTGGPLVIGLGIFLWGTVLYFDMRRVPQNALDINVVGKQWMWKLQHPEGRWENNELHIPVGRPIKLTLTSEDVIHAFFVPAFRIKMDVIPGQYTQTWFTPTKAGEYHLFCAEFCGTLHSKMTGTVYVMEPADYERWLSTGNSPQTVAALGQRLFIQNGCSGCHNPNSSVRAPLLDGIFGKPVPVQIPKPGVPLEQIAATTVVADQRYIHDSIVLPEQEVAAGYKPIMPTFKGRLKEEQILQLIAYIRSLGNNQGSAGGRRPMDTLTPDEYRARTGFLPENIKRLAGGGGSSTGAGTGTAGGSQQGGTR